MQVKVFQYAPPRRSVAALAVIVPCNNCLESVADLRLLCAAGEKCKPE